MPSASRRSRRRSRDLVREFAEVSQQAAGLKSDIRALRAKVDGGGSRFAALYPDFIDRFRGSTADVTAKLSGYLTDVRRVVEPAAGSVAAGTGVVDVGSGRGEWLALLRDSGCPHRGSTPTPNSSMPLGRVVSTWSTSDAAAHLLGLPAGSVDMVTAFHLIEHLDVETLLELLAAAWHALRPGGCVLLETPNPSNLRMAACDFYNDPTHRSPLPPDLTEYLVSASGFDEVEVRPRNPNRSAFVPADSGPCRQVEQLVADAVFGPQDYAVLGYKPQSVD